MQHRIRIVLIFLFLKIICLPAGTGADEIIIKENNRASKAIAIIEELKKYISDKDRAELEMLEIVQRNLARKYVVLSIDRSNLESELKKYLKGTVYNRVHPDYIPIKAKMKGARRGNTGQRDPNKKSTREGFKKAEKMERTFKNNASKK